MHYWSLLYCGLFCLWQTTMQWFFKNQILVYVFRRLFFHSNVKSFFTRPRTINFWPIHEKLFQFICPCLLVFSDENYVETKAFRPPVLLFSTGVRLSIRSMSTTPGWMPRHPSALITTQTQCQRVWVRPCWEVLFRMKMLLRERSILFLRTINVRSPRSIRCLDLSCRTSVR